RARRAVVLHQVVEVEASQQVLERGLERNARTHLDGSDGLGPALPGIGMVLVVLPYLAQAVGGERLGSLGDEQRLIEGIGRGAPPRAQRVLVRHRGGDDGAERDQQDRHQQRNAALAARRTARVARALRDATHPAISMMRTILPQSSVSSVISTASGR